MLVGPYYRIPVSNKYADYYSSSPKINISYDSFIVNSGRRLSTYNQSITGVNATAGVAFNISKIGIQSLIFSSKQLYR